MKRATHASASLFACAASGLGPLPAGSSGSSLVGGWRRWLRRWLRTVFSTMPNSHVRGVERPSKLPSWRCAVSQTSCTASSTACSGTPRWRSERHVKSKYCRCSWCSEMPGLAACEARPSPVGAEAVESEGPFSACCLATLPMSVRGASDSVFRWARPGAFCFRPGASEPREGATERKAQGDRRHVVNSFSSVDIVFGTDQRHEQRDAAAQLDVAGNGRGKLHPEPRAEP